MPAVALHLSFTLPHRRSTKPNYPVSFFSITTKSSFPVPYLLFFSRVQIFRSRSPSTKLSLSPAFSSHSSISRNGQGWWSSFSISRLGVQFYRCLYHGICLPGAFDSELRPVLELATDSELFELETILFGPRYWFLWFNLFYLVNGRKIKIKKQIIN